MSKLIVNTGTLSSGGAERVLSILSSSFADSFDEVKYVMWLDAKYPEIFYEIDARVEIVKISKETGSTSILKNMLWFRKFVKREKPDLVLSFMVMVCFTVTISLLFTGICQVVAERNDPRFFKNRWIRKLINYSYYSPDIKGIIMQTKWNMTYFESNILYAKTHVIHNPIDINNQLVGVALRTQKKDIIVSVGRLTSQKQQSVLVKAFATFYKTHPSYRLILYGEGEERDNLANLADNLGIKERLFLPGRSKQVINDISFAKIFVMSSLYEGMSNALIEAMCVGLPCISTKVSGATDLINDGENGFLVDTGDDKMIAEKMTMLADNPKMAETFGKKASDIYSLLSKEIICKEWIEYLYSVI